MAEQAAPKPKFLITYVVEINSEYIEEDCATAEEAKRLAKEWLFDEYHLWGADRNDLDVYVNAEELDG